jgi:hypothetical protein
MRYKRKRALLASVLGALMVLSASWASADVVPSNLALPTMTVNIGGDVIPLNLQWNYSAALDTFSLAGPVTATASNGSTFTIGSAQSIPDPLLLFAASAINTTANSLAYSFAFNSPLAPNLLGLVDSYAELGVTLTDGLNDGATV